MPMLAQTMGPGLLGAQNSTLPPVFAPKPPPPPTDPAPVDVPTFSGESNGLPSYGGYASGSGDMDAYTNKLATNALAKTAPQLTGQYEGAARYKVQQGLSQEASALGSLASSAAGGGPGAALAQGGYDTSANAALQQGLMASGAGKDAASRAAAGGAAIGATGATLSTAAAQAGAARAQSAESAQQAYQRGAQGYSGLAQGQEQSDYEQALANANLQEQQNAINQRGQVGFLSLSEQANASQEAAQAQIDAAQEGQYAAAAKMNAQNQSALIGAGLGLATGATTGAMSAGGLFGGGGGPSPAAAAAPSSSSSDSNDYNSASNMWSDVKMREPGGGSGWTLREEPTFLLARNDRTGELRKLATEPLSRGERKQALAPHGAGPIGSRYSSGRVVADLGLSGDAALGQYDADMHAPQVMDRYAKDNWNTTLQGLQQQQQGIGLLSQTASGQGHAIQAAQGQVAQNTAQGIAGTNAIASSAQGGGRGLAAAKNTAAMQAAQAQGTGAQQQKMVAGQMQANAMNQLPGAEQAYGQSALGSQNMWTQWDASDAQLQQQQQALGQQSQLQLLGIGNAGAQSDLQAQVSEYGTQATAQQVGQQLKDQQNNQLIGAGAGIIAPILMAAL